ncbi:MAG: T9SS type A sorting domain-containing protein [Bacteroidales bacterium]|nr:T9SS type A sorting domain-containing protein [Bacteroidales bacterium]
MLEKGLIRYENGTLTKDIAPNGPRFVDLYKVAHQDNTVWMGGVYGLSVYKEEKWQSFSNTEFPEWKNVYYFQELAIDPNNPDHVFSGTNSYGVAELDINGNAKMYGSENTVFEPISGYENLVYISGMTYDSKGNLWVVSNFSFNPIYVLRTSGEWEKIELNYTGFGPGTRVSKILSNSYGDIWVIVERSGIISFRENDDGSISEKFFTVRNQSGELYDRIFSLTEDQEGDIWVGTGQGPVVYYKPVIDYASNTSPSGYQILIPRKGEKVVNGEIPADPLLENERINCIVVDGANRKWMGTERSGAFLMSADGKEEIHHFSTTNSPLFSDNVVSIALNNNSGEIFYGTDKGLISFKGQATDGSEEYSDVYVYPNPVRENYSGDITITGLITNSNIKITDISGNLVYETTSLGGQAIWDGKNFRGEKVHTGVYLVFCSNEDGTKTHVTKLLFIH